jgi:hypothetical protein
LSKGEKITDEMKIKEIKGKDFMEFVKEFQSRFVNNVLIKEVVWKKKECLEEVQKKSTKPKIKDQEVEPAGSPEQKKEGAGRRK